MYTTSVANSSRKSSGFLNSRAENDFCPQDHDAFCPWEHVVDRNNNESEQDNHKNRPTWHRVKWTDQMVMLLITAVSYTGDDSSSSPLLPKKGRWKSISKVMSERGFLVSPQQCEDKFNDLNKRYKKLNDILGRGISCQVVENPTHLGSIQISENSKETVRKILSSKQLFYREMCSYHNGNRIYIPHDQDIQKSLHLALGEDESVDSDQILNFQTPNENYALNDHEKMQRDCQEENWLVSRGFELEEEKLRIEAEMMGLERERLRWIRSGEVEDRELEKMRMENKCLMLKYKRMGLEIRRREMGRHAMRSKFWSLGLALSICFLQVHALLDSVYYLGFFYCANMV